MAVRNNGFRLPQKCWMILDNERSLKCGATVIGGGEKEGLLIRTSQLHSAAGVGSLKEHNDGS
ncbi:unnamed protein product [Dovyalis caffra]|uniref:Uncharacterized protein n=1 Tax=Dovyalis caffra TaxID=77055 RepID=A0AAV1S1Z8_9ROSI|nr:unnamed protein product [Dovyalis caffra]